MPASPALMIEPREHDLGGGFMVRRLLPFRLRRHIGPFVFFDHFGPTALKPGQGMDVRPHPHIGLATVTYLFEGAITHRDSLGHVQVIRPGDVNWMTAGRGIVHSERTPPEERAAGHRLHGIQTWVALPLTDEETTPGFHHHEAADLPTLEQSGVRLRVIAGNAFGRASPVRVYAGTLYVAAEFPAGSRMMLPMEHAERGIYVATGALRVGDRRLAIGQMLVLGEGDAELAADAPTLAMLFGGAPLDGERILWWNFVASSRDRIERGKKEWKEGRFVPVPGETEFIPLPEQ